MPPATRIAAENDEVTGKRRFRKPTRRDRPPLFAMIRDDALEESLTFVMVTVGIAAFLVPQVALFLTTAQPPTPIEDPGWFLNSGRNVATIASVIVLTAMVLAVRRRWQFQDAAAFGSGVLLAMVATLFTIGPGTIFPIVIVAGAVVVAFATLAGSAIGLVVRMGSARRRTGRG